MLCAVKVANVETAVALFEGGDLVESWTQTTRTPSTADELDVQLRSFLQVKGLPMPDRAILCSVVPTLTDAWRAVLRSISGARPLVVGPGLKSGIAMGYKDPGQMGADRVALAVAARELHGAPVIVADCDAITSITVVDRDGALVGGAIALGIGMSLEALASGAAQLAETDLRLPNSVIARTTHDAMRSGVICGEAARIDGVVQATWEELGYHTALVITGRYADLASRSSRLAFEKHPDLALEGLRIIFEMNQRL